MKLLIADDHQLFRDTLVQYIERAVDGAQITVADSFDGAFDILREDEAYDLVLLDYQMPGMYGIEGFETVRYEFPMIRVALMSGVAEAEYAKRVMDLGAVGFFPKTLSGKALLNGIQSVLEGKVFLPLDPKTHQIMPTYYGELKSSGDHELLESLTKRERQVLGFLSSGSSNKEIARELELQEVTVKLHVRGVCRKLGAKNRTQAALIAQDKSFFDVKS